MKLQFLCHRRGHVRPNVFGKILSESRVIGKKSPRRPRKVAAKNAIYYGDVVVDGPVAGQTKLKLDGTSAKPRGRPPRKVQRERNQRSQSMSPQRRGPRRRGPVGGIDGGILAGWKKGSTSFRQSSPLRRESRSGELCGAATAAPMKFSDKQYLNILQSMGQSVHIFDLDSCITFWAMDHAAASASLPKRRGRSSLKPQNETASIQSNKTPRKLSGKPLGRTRKSHGVNHMCSDLYCLGHGTHNSGLLGHESEGKYGKAKSRSRSRGFYCLKPLTHHVTRIQELGFKSFLSSLKNRVLGAAILHSVFITLGSWRWLSLNYANSC